MRILRDWLVAKEKASLVRGRLALGPLVQDGALDDGNAEGGVVAHVLAAGGIWHVNLGPTATPA